MNRKCTVSNCNGRVRAEFSEQSTNDTIKYLQRLFDHSMYLQEHNKENTTSGNQKSEHPHKDTYDELKAYVAQVL